MTPDLKKLDELVAELKAYDARLIAVTKTKPIESVQQVFEHGHRDFGENYVQELLTKHDRLPDSIKWHFIGHLQSNKVKFIAPFVHLIHGIDSMALLQETGKMALRNLRTIDVLLQVHISGEATKFGFSIDEAFRAGEELQHNPVDGVRIRGLMGMASFTEDQAQIRKEFRSLKKLYDMMAAGADNKASFNILSMGMTGDYKIALDEGSNMVRIGSAIFGERNQN